MSNKLPPAPWEKAQALRKYALTCKSRTTAKILYAQARYYEKKAGFTSTKNNPVNHRQSIQDRERNEADSFQLPLWFRRAKSLISCSECGAKSGVYWYKIQEGLFVRTRLLPAVKSGNQNRVKDLMSTSIVLCREHANKVNK